MTYAAIFDMDGLLIDSEPLWRQAEITCFSEVGISLTEDDCRDTMGYRLNEVIEHWYEKQPWENLTSSELESNIIRKVIELVHLSGKPLPGVDYAIELFESLGFGIALASSSPDILIREVLKALQLEDKFTVVHSAEHEQWGKPHPQVFISTAEKLGIETTDCVVIEDSFHGIIAGKAAKMKVIAVPDPYDFDKPGYGAADLVLTSLEKLNIEHLQKLFGDLSPQK